MSVQTKAPDVHGPEDGPHGAVRARPLFDPPIVKRALWESILKLNPRTLMKNPVIFVVEVVSVMVTVRIFADISSSGPVAVRWSAMFLASCPFFTRQRPGWRSASLRRHRSC